MTELFVYFLCLSVVSVSLLLGVKWDVRVGGQALVETRKGKNSFRAFPASAIPLNQEMH